MLRVKPCIIAAALLATAFNPVVASFVPCCCTVPHKPINHCRMAAQRTSQARGHHSCCKLAKTGAARHDTNLGVRMAQSGCCCVAAQPVPVTTVSKIAKPCNVQNWLALAPTLDGAFAARPSAGTRVQPAELFPRSAPQLLAMYSIWLK